MTHGDRSRESLKALANWQGLFRVNPCGSPASADSSLFTLHYSLSEGAVAHTTRGCNRCDERRERSYYHLHRNLNKLLLHRLITLAE